MMQVIKRMSLRLLVLAMMTGAIAAHAAEEAQTATQPTGKVELFNGKDLSNWQVWLKDEKADPAKTFTVEGGVLKCTGEPFGYIRSKEAYKNYVLTVEWRFVKDGNTGVLVHTSGPDKTWPKALECQGQHGKQGNLVAFADVKFEGMKGMNTPRPGPDVEKPIGEWNTYKIVCDGDSVKVFLNGTLVNQAPQCTVTSGQICLQSEGGVWECRKATLEPVTAEAGK